ncbi:hypothetical protein [Haloarchaeobius amylolyticus]|uniref:hypothetical protein n=1 Tax=Haloarchaeobius amylolyticus TaxID=1198296 RepID=UPI00226ECFC6|nr:hypothetical protein [Haloarchaeobius amylolyticus]
MTETTWYTADLDLAELVDELPRERVLTRVQVREDITAEERELVAAHLRGLAASLSEQEEHPRPQVE